MDKEGRFNFAFFIAETFEDGGPTVNPIHGGLAKADTQLAILLCDGGAIALFSEDICTCDESGWSDFVASLECQAMAFEHGFYGFGVTFGNPIAFGVFIDN